MAFVIVGKVSEIAPGSSKVFELDDRAIALCNVDGTIYAIDDVCSHDEAPLDQGFLEGCEIECPRHGARFDVRTGEVKALPAVLPIDTFQVRVEGDDIEVDL